MCTFAIAVTPREWLQVSLFLTLNTIINMALIRNTAAMRLRGRVGNTTYYTEGGRQIARVSQNASNYGETARRTEMQQSQRAKWANLVNFYKLSKGWMRQAFESKKRTQSDYNRFMQLNVASASVYLTRDMYSAGGCVVEPYVISEGSLRSILITKETNAWRTDLNLGQLTIDEQTTVGTFSQALIANNSHLHEGVQISMVSYQQEISSYGVPQLICTAYEVTLDTNSASRLRDFLPDFASQTINGHLGTSNTISTGAFAYVLSDSTSGKTLVSSQRLVNNNAVLIGQYSSADAVQRSIESYGVDGDVFLMSGSKAQQAAAGTQYVAYAVAYNMQEPIPVDSISVDLGALAAASEGKFFLAMSSVIGKPISQISVRLWYYRNEETTAELEGVSAVAVSGNMLLIQVPNSSYDYKLADIYVSIGDETYMGHWRYSGVVIHE